MPQILFVNISLSVQLFSNIQYLLQLSNRLICHVQWFLCFYFSIPYAHTCTYDSSSSSSCEQSNIISLEDIDIAVQVKLTTPNTAVTTTHTHTAHTQQTLTRLIINKHIIITILIRHLQTNRQLILHLQQIKLTRLLGQFDNGIRALTQVP